MQTGTFNAGSGRYAPATFETRGDKEYIVCLLARASGGEPDKSPRPWASPTDHVTHAESGVPPRTPRVSSVTFQGAPA